MTAAASYIYTYIKMFIQGDLLRFINRLDMVIFIASYGLADFQTKFYIKEGVIHFYFSMRVGHLFYNFLQWGVTNVYGKLRKVLPAHP